MKMNRWYVVEYTESYAPEVPAEEFDSYEDAVEYAKELARQLEEDLGYEIVDRYPDFYTARRYPGDLFRVIEVYSDEDLARLRNS